MKYTPMVLVPVFTPSKSWWDDLDPDFLSVPSIPPAESYQSNGKQAEEVGTNLPWFYYMFHTDGDWDYKNNHPEYENGGNYNFGYAGTKAGFDRSTLLCLAGAYQFKSHSHNEGTGFPGIGDNGG